MEVVTNITAGEATKMYDESQKYMEDAIKRTKKLINGGSNE